jgi:hypothetical protein
MALLNPLRNILGCFISVDYVRFIKGRTGFVLQYDFDVVGLTFFSLALQPQFGPWPTSKEPSVSLRFSRP